METVVLSNKLWVPRSRVEPAFFKPYLYRVYDSYERQDFDVETFDQTIDTYGFPRGDMGKLIKTFGEHFNIDDQRSAVPLEYPIKFVGKLTDEQSRSLRQWIEAGYGMLEAPPRWGKCVVGGSLVSTSSGFIRIEDLPSLRPVQVGSLVGLSSVSHYHTRRAKRTVTAVTDCGFSVSGTPEHSVLTLDRSLRYAWTPLSEVTPGLNCIAVKYGHLGFAQKPCPVVFDFKANPKYTSRTKIYKIPSVVTKEIARLLGYLVAEGRHEVGYRSFRVVNTDLSIISDVQRCVAKTFGASLSKSVDRRNSVITLGKTSRQLSEFLVYLGIGDETSAYKDVPWCILRSPKNIVANFLRAYFDGDGWVEEDKICVCTASDRLSQTIQILLAAFGIVAKRSCRRQRLPSGEKRPYYKLCVSGKDIDLFHAEIGFGSSFKRRFVGRKRIGKRSAVIPFVAEALRGFVRKHNLGGGWYDCTDGVKRQLSLGPSVASGKYANITASYLMQHVINPVGLVDPTLAARLAWLAAHGDLFWDKVDQVARINKSQNVFDLTVPDQHAFVANGIVVHNTVWMTALLCKLKQKALMLAHIEDLCHQLEDTVRKFTNIGDLEQKYGLKLCGVLKEWTDFFPILTLSTYQCFAVSDRGKAIIAKKRDDFGLVVVDEAHRCFRAGTMVGACRIEDIRVGDLVSSYNHQDHRIESRRVVGVLKTPVGRRLLSVGLEDGRRLFCTPEHPFWTSCGYRYARDLSIGSVLTIDPKQGFKYGEEKDCNGSLHSVSETRRVFRTTTEGSDLPFSDRCLEQQGLLLRDLPQGVSTEVSTTAYWQESGILGRVQPQICFRAHDEEKSHERSCDKSEGLDDVAFYAVAAESSRGERTTSTDAAGSTSRRPGMADRSCCEDRNASSGIGLPDVLQDRCSQLKPQSWNRDRRRIARFSEDSKVRSEEGGILAPSRVVSLEVHEPGSDGRFGGLCPDGFVYNLEVEGNHNYFAEGVLTHNCKTELYTGVLGELNSAYRCGVTATPKRKDKLHCIVNDVLGPVTARGQGEQLDVDWSWEYTDNYVEEFRSWATLWNRLAKCNKRNNKIAARVVDDVQAGHFVLVTTERLEHIDVLRKKIQKLDPDITVAALSGKTVDREKFRKAALKGEYQVVIAMNRIVELGYNIPRWSCLHNTLPMTNRPNWYQRISRIRTPFEPAFPGDTWTKPKPLCRIWSDYGHKAIFAYKAVVKAENDARGFTCLTPEEKKRKPGKRQGLVSFESEPETHDDGTV